MSAFSVISAAEKAAEENVTIVATRNDIKPFNLGKGKQELVICVPLKYAFKRQLYKAADLNLRNTFNLSPEEVTDSVEAILQKKDFIHVLAINVYTAEVVAISQNADVPNSVSPGFPKGIIWSLVDTIGASEEMPVLLVERVNDQDKYSALYISKIDTKAEEKEPAIIETLRKRLLDMTALSEDELFEMMYPQQSIDSIKVESPLFAKKLEMFSRFGNGER